jgi:hypothetical protein
MTSLCEALFWICPDRLGDRRRTNSSVLMIPRIGPRVRAQARLHNGCAARGMIRAHGSVHRMSDLMLLRWDGGTRCNVSHQVPVQKIGKAANVRQAPGIRERTSVVFFKTYQWMHFKICNGRCLPTGVREDERWASRRRRNSWLVALDSAWAIGQKNAR